MNFYFLEIGLLKQNYKHLITKIDIIQIPIIVNI